MIKITKISERQRLDNLLTQQEVKIGGAFLKFVDSLQSDKILKEINDAIEANDFTRIDRIIDSYIITFANIFPAVFSTVAASEAERMIEDLSPTAIAVGFDSTHPRAADKARQGRMELLRGLTIQQRQATQQAIASAFETGYSPRQVARAIRESIGLTPRQEQAVRNYRRMLESQSAEALSRELRDRRFDRTVRNAFSGDKVKTLTSDQIDKMVEAYRKNSVNHRALVIARTQGLRAMNEARNEALEQVMEPLSEFYVAFKTWIATHDGRTRDWHASMTGQKVRMGQPFVDGLGNVLQFPGDPSAPAETTISCRCSFTVDVVPIDEE